MSEIVEVAIDKIAINPYRRLHAYPYIESKLEALQRSIADIGLWPSVIARPLKDKLWSYEMAFGHHRVEAARRSRLERIPLIVEKLTDKQMLQYMGRENLEDYNAVFLIQLESWEAAAKFPFAKGKTPQPLDIANLLGWTRLHGKSIQLNNTADACYRAHALMKGGYMAREDFAEQTVAGARDIAERTLARIEHLDKVGKTSMRPKREIEAAKHHVASGARDTARQVREGAVPWREIRSRVDFNANIHAQKANKPSPLFVVFANAVIDNLRRTLQTDSDADKLAAIEKALPQITMDEDFEALRRLDVELVNLAQRAEGWRKRLIPPKDKIRHIRSIDKA